jgi:hypothetical protein
VTLPTTLPVNVPETTAAGMIPLTASTNNVLSSVTLILADQTQGSQL